MRRHAKRPDHDQVVLAGERDECDGQRDRVSRTFVGWFASLSLLAGIAAAIWGLASAIEGAGQAHGVVAVHLHGHTPQASS